MVGLQTTRLESAWVNCYKVTLDFTSRKGKNTLWFYSLVVRSLLQVKVQNSNDFIAREKGKKKPRVKKYLALKNFWVKFFDAESREMEIDIVFQGNLENYEGFFLFFSWCCPLFECGN